MNNNVYLKKAILFIYFLLLFSLFLSNNHNVGVFAQTITEQTDTTPIITTTPEKIGDYQSQLDQQTQEIESPKKELYTIFNLSNKTISFEIIGSIVAILIGLFALTVSVWQGYETRNNYRLSVTPKITFYGHWRNDKMTPGVYIQNKGLGPAIITKVEVLLDGKIVDINSYGENLFYALEKAVFTSGIPQFTLFIMLRDEVIASGENQLFIGLTEKDNNDLIIDNLNKAFSRVSLRIDYLSIYKQKFSQVCDVSSYEFINGIFVER